MPSPSAGEPSQLDDAQRLAANLDRTHAFEADRAAFYRQHRADLASKMRFGLVGLNGGSAVAIATLYGSSTKHIASAGVDQVTVLVALVAFLFGAWLAGWALQMQFLDAINSEGDANVRAMNLATAADFSSSSSRQEQVTAAFEALRTTPFVRSKHDDAAIWFVGISWGCWVCGSMSIAFSISAHLLGAWVKTLY